MPYTMMVKLIVVNRRDSGLCLVPNISAGAFFSSVAYTPVYQVSRTVFYYDADDFSNIVDIADFCSNRENNAAAELQVPGGTDTSFILSFIHLSYIIHTSSMHHPYIIHTSSIHHPSSIHHHESTIYDTCYSICGQNCFILCGLVSAAQRK